MFRIFADLVDHRTQAAAALTDHAELFRAFVPPVYDVGLRETLLRPFQLDQRVLLGIEPDPQLELLCHGFADADYGGPELDLGVEVGRAARRRLRACSTGPVGSRVCPSLGQ